MTRAVALRVRIGWPALALVLLAGCGSRLHPVEGQVVFKDGTPVPGGRVVFERLDGDKTSPPARGEVGTDGKFRLSTYAKEDGAFEGRYRVAVAPPLPTNVRDLGRGRVFHEKYESAETSGVEARVTSGPNNIKIVVEKP